MKCLSLIAAAVLFTLQADLAYAQVIPDKFDEYQQPDHSATKYQWGTNYPHNTSSGYAFGVVWDSDGAIGLSNFLDGWMLDIMMRTDEEEDGVKLKLGRSFMVTGDQAFNINLYGMGGYSSVKSGPGEDLESGLLLEGGTILAFDTGTFGGLGLGAGYVYDLAIEEEYFTFRVMSFIDY